MLPNLTGTQCPGTLVEDSGTQVEDSGTQVEDSRTLLCIRALYYLVVFYYHVLEPSTTLYQSPLLPGIRALYYPY